MIRRAERKSYKWVGIAAAVLLLAAVLVFGLRIKEVSVSGSNRYTPEQIENILFSGRWGNNTILAFIRDKTQPHRQIPFVEKYKIVFHGPFKAEVIIYDKSIVGYVSYMSSYMYFDRDGIIVESSPDCLPGVPWIIRPGIWPYCFVSASSCKRSQNIRGDLKSDPAAFSLSYPGRPDPLWFFRTTFPYHWPDGGNTGRRRRC